MPLIPDHQVGALTGGFFNGELTLAYKKLRAPNSCGIGRQPLDRRVVHVRQSFELFNEQPVINHE